MRYFDGRPSLLNYVHLISGLFRNVFRNVSINGDDKSDHSYTKVSLKIIMNGEVLNMYFFLL